MAKFNTASATMNDLLEVVRADEKFYSYVGYANGQSLALCVHPEDAQRLQETARAAQGGEEPVELAYRLRTVSGDYHWVMSELSHEEDVGDGEEEYIHVEIQDLDTLRDNLNEIKDTELLRSELLNLSEGIYFCYEAARDGGHLEIFSGAGKDRVNYYIGTLDKWDQMHQDPEMVPEAYSESFRALCRNLRAGTHKFEHTLQLQEFSIDPEKEVLHVSGKTYRDSSGHNCVVGSMQVRGKDGSQSYSAVSFAESSRDITTGLLNKKASIDYVKRVLALKPLHKVHVCILDIDNFKQVNDTLGHMFGDEVLQKVADILKEAAIGFGIAGRFGGDEMMLMLEGLNEEAELRGVLRSIRANVEWAYKDRKEVPAITCSIGVASYPEHGDEFDDLFRIADKMLYMAKERGKNRYLIYTPEIHGDVLHAEDAQVRFPGGYVLHDREGLVLRLLQHFLRRHHMPYEQVLKETGECFRLDEICIFYGEPDKLLSENYWCSSEELRNRDRRIDFVKEEHFDSLYQEHGMTIIENFAAVAALCPETSAYLQEHGVRAALIYRIKDEKHEGYITYFRNDSSTRKWSDSDKNYLLYISKMIELVIGGTENN